ncbi:MAG: 50S ribosomal protein L23 [Verrucomicrobia bacterium]|nr:50S ribosomal protein L23 [Verrucomicrobiota bacterium]
MKDFHSVIKTVRVTEKGTAANEKANQYQVVVANDANKIDIKYAVEKAFKVKVVRVNTMHVRGKARRQMTRQAGVTSAWKKALVTLKAGDKIEIA